MHWFLPNINMNQPLIYLCPLPPEHPSHFPPQPIALGCYQTPVWVPSVIQQIPIDFLSFFFPLNILFNFFFLFLKNFFLLLFFFTLQYCIGFVIHQHASATGVHVFPILNPLPPPSPYHPSGSSQCTSPKLPVSCIEPWLAIHFLYDIHVLMPFSQIIPRSLSHRVQKTVLYICVSFAVSHLVLFYWSHNIYP